MLIYQVRPKKAFFRKLQVGTSTPLVVRQFTHIGSFFSHGTNLAVNQELAPQMP